MDRRSDSTGQQDRGSRAAKLMVGGLLTLGLSTSFLIAAMAPSQIGNYGMGEPGEEDQEAPWDVPEADPEPDTEEVDGDVLGGEDREKAPPARSRPPSPPDPAIAEPVVTEVEVVTTVVETVFVETEPGGTEGSDDDGPGGRILPVARTGRLGAYAAIWFVSDAETPEPIVQSLALRDRRAAALVGGSGLPVSAP